MELLRRCYAKLCRTVNETNSAVAMVRGRQLLGYSFWSAPKGESKRKVAAKPLALFKHRVRQLTRRSGGRSMGEVGERWRP
jgi:RNA-directed DNA polymerase